MERTIWYGGNILTMNREYPRCEAVLVEKGKISAVGTRSELQAMAPDALFRDLGGRTLMPAFVDGHSHMSGVGLALQKCDLAGCRSFEELLERIRTFREKHDLTHGEVIHCRGYDPAIMEEGQHPTAALLDSLGFDNPIGCTHASGHVAVYNTVAMRRCGVDDSYVPPEGGFAGRDADGHLTGYFEERAMAPFSEGLGKATDAEVEKAILDAQDYYLSNGITTIQDGSGNGAARIAIYRRLAEEGKLKADVVVYIQPDPQDPGYWEETIRTWGNRMYHRHLKLGGIKLMLDGSPQARTAWMRKPYEGESEYCGYPVRPDEWVRRVLENAIRAGLQPLAHCNGDAAAQQFLDQWEAAVKSVGHGTELRPVMVHAQTVGMDQLDRMKGLGMLPSFFVGHCWFWGDVHMKNFGERAQHISPVQSALNRGLIPNFHQDAPVTPPNMIHSVWCAVNRITRNGVRVGASEAVSPYEALIAATHGGAYSYFEEDTKGILRPGAVADLVVRDADPTGVEPEKIREIRVLETVKDGKTVFSR